MLEQLRLEDFLPFLGQTIDVAAHGRHAGLELATAELLRSPSPRATPSFHLILRSAENWQIPQGMFTLNLPGREPIELFAVPIGPDGKGLCYEIVFN
ncbi:MAG: hypothetical protein DYH18_07845 [Xanthomonadales bacterium PRO7]|nr:hypothetical protein [Xanthomonadales bacterium PRO7]HMM58245.1 hypothetical protein [Rudaea sp.]